MKTKAIILAGGEGSRLGVLTAKRTKPAVPFAGKYRIIDFTLSNCVNSKIDDVMILAQYRPHSLIDHIGVGSPWDLNRDFTGGVKIYTPYKARRHSDWYLGTADAVQQNFNFMKSSNPDLILILSGDHIYGMDYDSLITFHLDHQADVTIGTISVPIEEASRFGIMAFDDNYRITEFIEKPENPPSNQVNMGVYLFNLDVLDTALWDDYNNPDSSHDFGRDIIPKLLQSGSSVYAYPYSGYWVDVGTVSSYWQAHMDLLNNPPPLDLNDRSWIFHTRTEERPPVRIASDTTIIDSLITDGCIIEAGAKIERCILGPGVQVKKSAFLKESILLTDSIAEANCKINRSVIDKRVKVMQGAELRGNYDTLIDIPITMVGKNSVIPENVVVHAGAIIHPDVDASDFENNIVQSDTIITRKRRIRHEI